MRIDDRILKIPRTRDVPEGWTLYPWCAIRYLPQESCVFDSYRGTIGFDLFPFAITTKVSAAAEVFLWLYEEN